MDHQTAGTDSENDTQPLEPWAAAALDTLEATASVSSRLTGRVVVRFTDADGNWEEPADYTSLVSQLLTAGWQHRGTDNSAAKKAMIGELSGSGDLSWDGTSRDATLASATTALESALEFSVRRLLAQPHTDGM